MVEAHIQSLNPVSPEFVPRSLPPAEVEQTNGWSEPPTQPPPVSAPPQRAPLNNHTNGNSSEPSGWNESPSGDTEWQAGMLLMSEASSKGSFISLSSS